MQFSIDITIDQDGVEAINSSGQKVTLVQSVVSNPPSSDIVAWLAFSPLESNLVTWQEEYYIYATTTEVQSGATIQMTSQTESAAQLGWTYTFANGIFNGASGGDGTAYNANNQQGGTYGMGLAQQAMVNNVQTFAPLSVVDVLNDETANFTPEIQLSIFLSASQNNGSVLSQVAGNAYSFTLSSSVPSISLDFNDTTNTFYPATSTAAFSRRLRRRK